MKPLKKTHVKSGDLVYINTGTNAKKVGKILGINRKKGKALIIFPEQEEKGVFIHVSNLYYFDSITGLYSRIGYKIVENKKERFLKKTKKNL